MQANDIQHDVKRRYVKLGQRWPAKSAPVRSPDRKSAASRQLALTDPMIQPTG